MKNTVKLRHLAPGERLPKEICIAGDCAAYTMPEKFAALPDNCRVLTLCPETEDAAALLSALREHGVKKVRTLPGKGECCALLPQWVRDAFPEPAEEKPLPAARAEQPALFEENEVRKHTPLARLEFYRAEAFTDTFSGAERIYAAASEHLPRAADMHAAAQRFKARVVFAAAESDGTVSIRCFTPDGEEQPDASAVIAAFSVLRDKERSIAPGTSIARTKEGFLQVSTGEDTVWMETAPGPLVRMLTEEEQSELSEKLGLTGTGGIRAAMAGAVCLTLMEAPTSEALMLAAPAADMQNTMLRLGSRGLCLYHRPEDEEISANLRVFSGGGQEENASGMAAGLLGWWLHLLRRAGEETVFRQGSAVIRTFLGPDGRLFTGGAAALSDAPEKLP